jgi:hypothetical protein
MFILTIRLHRGGEEGGGKFGQLTIHHDLVVYFTPMKSDSQNKHVAEKNAESDDKHQ